MRLIDADELGRVLAVKWNDNDDNDFANKIIWQELREAPTINVKTGWIPVSERLPEARESVILSTKEWTGEGCYWETTKHHVIWKGYGWNATYWDDEVIAWMPLPEPYKGGDDE